MIPLVDLQAQFASIREEIEAAIGAVLASASFIGGSGVTAFEQEFAASLGVSHCVGCANGTDAIELLLAAHGIRPGDEVIVPALTWISTAGAVSALGAQPVFVDVIPGVYTIDPAQIEAAITDSTRAILPVHLYGRPAEMDAILEIAGRHSLLVFEDAAQAHGAVYRGRRVGSLGHGAAFSFYPGKNLGAYGDAGAVVTADPEVATRVRMFGNHGQARKHDHQRLGRNSRLDALQAAILRVKLKHLDNWNLARGHHAAAYTATLAAAALASGERITLPSAPADVGHAWHLYVVETAERDRVSAQLAAAGIGTAIHYPTPLPLVPAYAHLGHQAEDYPVASSACGRILSLPLYPELSESQRDTVCQQLLASVGGSVG